MKPAVGVIDYGVGNLYSVCRALEHSGAAVQVVTDPSQLESCPRLVLPGVGAFAVGMDELRKRGLVDSLLAYALADRPLLGICLGMQLLFEVSEEFGEHAGLGIIPGRVAPVPNTGSDGKLHKIPHVGWARLLPPRGEWDSPLFFRVVPGQAAYFVHSYAAALDLEEHCIGALTDYDGRLIVASVQANNVFGCQFHPEKSGKVGLQILSNFVSL